MTEPTFTPAKRPKPAKRNINIQLTPERYAELKAMATSAEITLKELVRQALDFAVDHKEQIQ